MSNADPRQPEDRGSALAVGLVLVLWGMFLYVYPQSANLPEWIQTLALFLAFVCFIMGAITAGAGISDLRQSQVMNDFGIAIALALIAYFLYFISGRWADQPAWSTAARIAVIPAALAAIFMFGVGISHLLTGRANGQRGSPVLAPESTAIERVEPRPAGTARFERIASALVAFVSLAAAIMALINEVRRGQ